MSLPLHSHLHPHILQIAASRFILDGEKHSECLSCADLTKGGHIVHCTVRWYPIIAYIVSIGSQFHPLLVTELWWLVMVRVIVIHHVILHLAALGMLISKRVLESCKC